LARSFLISPFNVLQAWQNVTMPPYLWIWKHSTSFMLVIFISGWNMMIRSEIFRNWPLSYMKPLPILILSL
jgi:hypothetical protein